MYQTKFLLLCLLFVGSVNLEKLSAKQPKSAKVLTSQQMREDIDYFFDFVGDVHPNMYAFVSKDSMDLRKAELYQKCANPMTLMEFQRHIVRLNGMFDGHTGINGYWRTENKPIYFPVPVRIIEGELFFAGYEYNTVGVKILSINGCPAEQLCEALSEAVNKESRKAKEMAMEYNFSNYLYSVVGLEPPFLVTTETNDISLPGFFHGQIRKRGKAVLARKKKLDSFIYPDDSIALIEYNTCLYDLNKKRTRKELNAWLNKTIEDINKQGIKHLFIDITRNGGGTTEANDYLIKRIYPESSTIKCPFSIKRSWRVRDFQAKRDYRIFLRPRFKRMYDAYFENARIKTDTFVRTYHPVIPCYHGNIYLLQGAGSYSAAVELSAWIEQSKVGLTLGEETGGMTMGYIDAVSEQLPNSKLNIRCSNKEDLAWGNCKPEQGFLPDIPVEIDYGKSGFNINELKKFVQLADEYKKNR